MVKYILKFTQPFVIFMAKLYVRFEPAKITGIHYYLWRNIIKPGDVLLSSNDAYFGSNFINPSEIKHGAFYIGEDSEGVCNVTEMIGEGCVMTDLVSFLTSKDRVIIVRPKFEYNLNAAIMNSISRVGSKYDYEFEKGDDEYYCFEHIVLAYKKGNSTLNFKNTLTLGHLYYSSSAFLDEDLFEILVDSDNFPIEGSE